MLLFDDRISTKLLLMDLFSDLDKRMAMIRRKVLVAKIRNLKEQGTRVRSIKRQTKKEQYQHAARVGGKMITEDTRKGKCGRSDPQNWTLDVRLVLCA